MSSEWRRTPKKKYKPRDPDITSAMMSKVKNRDSKAELLLRRELWKRNYRYRLHSKRLIGKPDIVFSRRRIVIFVDGDFWHGRALLEEGLDGLKRGIRTKRASWWIAKIEKTVERDRIVTEILRSSGWKVLRFWESEVLNRTPSVVEEIERSFGQSG
jgi:DNA mismatch endonuclease (patch repair protein)